VLENLMAKYLELPAYPDVAAALAEFASRGFQNVACSNGTERAVRASLESVGLMSRFSKVVSVDALRTFKPDPAVYEYLVAESGVPREKVWLISSNPFDVIGAKACGLRTAWVQRDAKRIFDPWGIEPDVAVHSLGELPGLLPPG
jgi:2-haloacid dehalogenase